MPRQILAVAIVFLLGLVLPGSSLLNHSLLTVVLADSTPQTLPLTQDWSNTGMITANDNWSAVPGIEGFLGQDLTTTTGTDPQTLLGTSAVANDLTVLANQTATTITNGDVAEFHTTSQTGAPGANPTIALQGSGTADAPHIILYLNTTGQFGINVAYNLRDIDCTTDNAQQQVALQYRIGSTGNFTNIAAGYVSDATSGPSICTLVTPVAATLPAAADNQAQVQVRIISTNAVGNDEWVGVDDISVTAGPPPPPTLNINDVTMAEGNSGTTTFTFTVSLTSAAAGNVTFDIATADGTAQDGTPAGEDNDYVAKSETGRTITAGNTSATFTVSVNGDTTTEPNETFLVNLTNITGATAGDTQGTGTITNDDITATPIHTIQGSGTSSPFVGTSVTTTGIVTGVKSNGFFIQEPDASVDSDPNTSEGIQVFTSSAPPAAAAIGNRVAVTGTVIEFIPTQDPNSPPLTEISNPTSISVLSTGNTLPAPIALSAAETTAPSETADPLDTLEEYEGMRVSIASLTAVAPTQGNINEPNATSTSNGVFYGVVTGIARPFREPGIPVSDPVPAPSPPNVPRFDENPERIRVDSDAQTGATAINLTTGTVVTNLTGVVDFGFRTYTILPDAAPSPTVGTLATATPVPVPTASELTVGTFNMQRFYDTVDDPGGDVVITSTAFNNRLNKASLAIRNSMRTPDVIGVVEMENLATLQAVANKVNNDAVANGDPNPNYSAHLVEGNDVGGIDVGFLVKTARVTVVDVTQFGKTDTFTNPNTGNAETLNDRPPLVLRATIARPGGGTLAFTVIVNHLRSLNGADDDTTPNGTGTEGTRVRAKRRAQAEYLANLIQTRQTNDPTEKIISVGDYNAFQFNDGLVDSMGTIKGTPAPPDQVVLPSSDLVNPDLTNLIDTVTPDQRYSFTFDGNAQSLDHILVNDDALTILNRFAYARNNADFPQIFFGDPNRPERVSDHDMPVAYFSIGVPQPVGSVIISEFRLRGPAPAQSQLAPSGTSRPSRISPSPAAPDAGSQNEFIEIYNNTDADIVVSTTDNSAGWSLVGSDGTIRFTIPNGAIIPARGHFLGVNSNGYSLSDYGGVNSAGGDTSYASDIPDDGGVALFRTSNAQNFTMENRLDAAGYATAPALYREGGGLPTGGPEFTLNEAEFSFLRVMSAHVMGLPKDTGENSSDFIGVSTDGAGTGLGMRLGAPGPENLISPIQRNSLFPVTNLDMQVSSAVAPNRVRTQCASAPECNPTTAQFGTISFRKTVTNNSSAEITRLRFRIIDITTFPRPSTNTADFRVLSSSNIMVTLTNGMQVPVSGTTLEQPPAQPLGGGWNSSLLTGTIDLSNPLPAGQSVNVQILLGVQQTGGFRFFFNVEAGEEPISGPTTFSPTLSREQ